MIDPIEEGFLVDDVVLDGAASDVDVVEVIGTSVHSRDHGIDDLLVDARRRLHSKR